MLASGVNYQRDSASLLQGFRLETLRLVQGHERVGIAVVDEGWRQVRCDVVDGRHVTPDDLPGGHVGRIGAESLYKALGRPTVTGVFGGGAEVEEVGDRIEDGYSLNRAAFPVDRFRSRLIAGPPACGQHQTKVAAGTPTRDA